MLQWWLYDDTHEALPDEKLFAQVQAMYLCLTSSNSLLLNIYKIEIVDGMDLQYFYQIRRVSPRIFPVRVMARGPSSSSKSENVFRDDANQA